MFNVDRAWNASMRIARTFLAVFNGLAQLFGVLCVLAGFAFLASAYAIKENRLLNGLVGVGAIALGVAFFAAKSLRIGQVEKLRRLIGRED